MERYRSPITDLSTKHVRVVLDGPCDAVKSVLMHRLTSGYFQMQPSTIRCALGRHTFQCNDIDFEVDIYDLIGLSDFESNNLYYKSADIMIEFFDISYPRGLDDIVTYRIPYLHMHSKPILLVGLKSDVRQETSRAEHSLFPHEFGPCLAHLIGAVKYMECSAKTNQGVQEVLEEAIRATYERSCYYGIVDDNLKSLLLSKVSMSEEWKSIIEKLQPFQLSPTIDPKLRYQLERLEEQLCTALSNGTSLIMSYDDFMARRTLAIDTFRLKKCDFDVDFLGVKYSKPGMTLCSSDQVHIATGTVSALVECAYLTKTSISLKFVKEDCSSITAFFASCGPKYMESLVIISCVGTLDLDFLSTLKGLENLIIIDTTVELSKLSFSTEVISTLKCIILNECQTDMTKIPDVIGMLSQLEILDVTCSSFKMLPESLRLLDNLRTLRCNQDQIVFPPKNVLQRSAQDVVQYLKAFHKEEVRTAYREAKIMVLGQEGVGKSTLVKSLKRTFLFSNTNPPLKTDGVDISVLHLPKYDCKVYDLAGDVEYLNTHALFCSPHCLHLAVFDLSHFIVSKGIRSSDLFSRLELWLQTIACQDPISYGIIVGTHIDHRMLSTQVLTRIRESLDQLLDQYRPIHNAILHKVDECLLCKRLSDNPQEGSPEKTADFTPKQCNDNGSEITDIPPKDSDDNRSGATEIRPRESNCQPIDIPESDDNQSGAGDICPKESNAIPPVTGEIPEDNEISLKETHDQSSVPHILGIFEVSGITNKNVKRLKRQLQNSIEKIKVYTNTEKIPHKWLVFRDLVKTKLSQSEELLKQPIFNLSQVNDLAYKSQIYSQSVITAMLRFFHSQGVFLWYEDFPVMKDVLILDPQWLSNQLRTLISHLPHVNAVCEGILHYSKLPEIWSDTSEENRSRLITLFRNVGLCFSISEMEDLFPCMLPVGWPDREMWPSLPKPDESQTSLVFTFSFLPPSFFPDLIVAINKKRASFPSSVQPLYYRFNVVYITKDSPLCLRHNNKRLMEIATDTSNHNEKEEPLVFHRIHFELMPYKNTMKVTIRGPRPCCMIPDIETTIETVKSRRYPGMSYDERVVCPECEMKKLHNPSTLAVDDSHQGFCHKGHNVGCIDDILVGKMSSSDLIPSAVLQAGRTMGDVLEDHFCPKLFAVLPINISSLSLVDRFVYSYLRDGYAVHLLCESPDEWHFVSSPGFRVGRPKEFFKIHGGRVCKLLRVISVLGAPFKIASAVDPHCKAGVAAAGGADKLRKEIKGLLDDYLEKYPYLKSSLGSPNDDLKDLKSPDGLSRTELSRFLEVAAKGRDFGPLTCTYVDKYNEWLWLCEEHNQKYSFVDR